MTTGLSYDGSVAGTASYIAELANLAVVQPNYSDPTDPFVVNLPSAITYAENRIYRELDLLSTVTRSSAYTLTGGNRNLTIPAADFVTIQELNVITPATITDPDQGTRNPLAPASKEMINNVYNYLATAGVPQYFAMIDQSNVIVGPWPNNNYTVEVTGTVRPASLSASNPTTFISLYLPDLMLMASMIFISGFQRNFGRQSDDPAMAQSYESQYKALMTGAMIEEARKKFQASAWSSMSPPVAASPTR